MKDKTSVEKKLYVISAVYDAYRGSLGVKGVPKDLRDGKKYFFVEYDGLVEFLKKSEFDGFSLEDVVKEIEGLKGFDAII